MQFNLCRCLLAEACHTLWLPSGDDDSNARSIILRIPFSLALHRMSLSVLSNSSRISKASLATARYIVPGASYDSVTSDAGPGRLLPVEGQVSLTVSRMKQSDHDLFRSHPVVPTKGSVFKNAPPGPSG